MNVHSAFIDGGAVYGSDSDTATKLRTLSNGALKTNNLGPTLPTRGEVGLEGGYQDILMAGDPRATVQPGVTSLYSLFLNEHNRIAENLIRVDPSLNDEVLYQKARLLVISQLQNIVYNEFLPAVLGTDWMTNLALPAPSNLTGFTSYDPSTDPGMYNEFTTVAFRFGHILMPNSLQVSNLPTQRTVDTHCPIKDHFFKTEEFILGSDQSGKAWENVLVASGQADGQPADSITNFLFCKDCHRDTGFGQDLFTRNIQRGRDHGLPGYTKFREFCQLSVPKNWNPKHRPEEISPRTWDKMKTVYKNVEDIDPFTGGAAEEPVSGGVVGPTFACLISKQFANIKEGDRLFFTHQEDGLPAGLSSMIKRRTLADIICDNIPIEELPLNTLKISAEKLKCSENNKLNFATVNTCLGNSGACPGMRITK